MSVMNPRVVRAAQRVLDSYAAERADLKTLTVAQLTELEHEMEHLRRNPDYTYRVGAEVVRAAAVMERESRTLPGGTPAKDPRDAGATA